MRLAFAVFALALCSYSTEPAIASDCSDVVAGAKPTPSPNWNSPNPYPNQCYVDFPGGGGSTMQAYATKCAQIPGSVFDGDHGSNRNTCIFPPQGQSTASSTDHSNDRRQAEATCQKRIDDLADFVKKDICYEYLMICEVARDAVEQACPSVARRNAVTWAYQVVAQAKARIEQDGANDARDRRGSEQPQKEASDPDNNPQNGYKEQFVVKNMATNTPSKAIDDDDSGHWFVVAGTFSVEQKSQIQEVMDLLNDASERQIHPTTIKTSNYSKLKPGSIAVVVGPTTKAAAEVNLLVVQHSVGDAYIKEGW